MAWVYRWYKIISFSKNFLFDNIKDSKTNKLKFFYAAGIIETILENLSRAISNWKIETISEKLSLSISNWKISIYSGLDVIQITCLKIYMTYFHIYGFCCGLLPLVIFFLACYHEDYYTEPSYYAQHDEINRKEKIIKDRIAANKLAEEHWAIWEAKWRW